MATRARRPIGRLGLLGEQVCLAADTPWWWACPRGRGSTFSCSRRPHRSRRRSGTDAATGASWLSRQDVLEQVFDVVDVRIGGRSRIWERSQNRGRHVVAFTSASRMARYAVGTVRCNPLMSKFRCRPSETRSEAEQANPRHRLRARGPARQLRGRHACGTPLPNSWTLRLPITTSAQVTRHFRIRGWFLPVDRVGGRRVGQCCLGW